MTGIPVLMYHAVVPDTAIRPSINPVHISCSAFEQQMAWLHRSGYSTLSIDEMTGSLNRRTAPGKKVVLTFDDGYYSLLHTVTPILTKYTFTASLFLTTGAVGQESYKAMPHFEASYPPDDRPLTWSELKTMQAAGWDIQAHGRRHLVHNRISSEELVAEMQGAQDDIRTHLDKEAAYYSFPYGSYNTACLRQLSRLNYKGGFSVHQGKAAARSDSRRWPRIEVNRWYDLEAFKRKVETGYASRSDQLKSEIQFFLFRNSQLKDFCKVVHDRLIKRPPLRPTHNHYTH